MQSREEKEKIINEMAGIFGGQVSVLVIEYRGLDVKTMQEVRKEVRHTSAELRIIKNKLLLKACEGTEIEKIKDLFSGPTAIAICGQEAPATAKVFVQARKKFENMLIKGGIVDGQVCDAAEIEKISKLPSRQALVSMFASTLATPLSNFANMLNQVNSKFLYALEALKQTKGGELSPEGAAEETPSGGEEEKSAAESPAEEVAEDKSPASEAEEKEQSSDNENPKEENSDG
ncbi:MAG: 50S ribosomal protein L10 [Candidatus Dadabacteria bacterium]|nr:50S ribosomal protein L10 [Candidatus Dadabacteria bacterium]